MQMRDAYSNRGTVILPLLGICLLLAWGMCFAIEYVESSTGLQSPEWEGGDSELEFGDMNGDGHLDIVSIGDHGSPYINTQEHGIMVYFGDGTGWWSVHQEGNFGYGGCAVGDVNNDGFMDLGYGMHHNYSGDDFGDQLIEVALGDGTGMSWTPWDDGLATNGEDYGMFSTDFGDVDNDGDLDLVSNSFGCCAGVHVYLNQGDGTWIQSFGFINGNSGDQAVFADINNDGNLDFAVAQEYGTVYFGDGTGGFTLGDANLPPISPYDWRDGIDLNDIDRDGGADLTYINTDGGIDVWRYNTSTSLWEDLSGTLPSVGNYYAAQLHDMNNDGWVDMLAFSQAVVITWFGSSTNPGDWTWATYTSTGPSPGYMSAFRVGGDADHNGYADYAVLVEEGAYPNEQNHLRFFRETSVPTELAIFPHYPRGNEVLIGGSMRFIDWTSAVPGGEQSQVDLHLSTTGENGPWIPIAYDLPNNGRYQWLVPEAFSSVNCYIRYRVRTAGDTAMAITYNPFELVGSGGAPMLLVEPTLLDFDTVYIDSTAVLEFLIANVGTDTLHVAPFAATLEVFSLNAGALPLELQPGGEVSVEVTFQPEEAIGYRDSVVISSDGGDEMVHLRGVGELYSVVEDGFEVVPEQFGLGNPYPNPFNAVVTIPLAVRAPGHVTLSVVNVMGQRVAMLSDRHFDTGDYRLTWDAEHAASGVYFAVLEIEGRTWIKKMVFMK
jgi:hypothetical protein